MPAIFRSCAILTAFAVGTAALAQTPSGTPSGPPSGAPSTPPSATSTEAPFQESTVVAELEVIKRLPGPALWKVTKGDAQVIILGGLTPLPHTLEWDSARIQRALDGASALYLQPRPRLGILGSIGLVFNKSALELPHGQSLQQVLTPPERARFLALMAAVHKKPKDYDHWKPAVAGLLLIADWRKAAGLSEGKPGTTVMHLAKDARVPVRYVGDFDLGPYIKTVRTLSPAANQACFDAAMDDIDRENAHAHEAATAWAKGDLKGVGQSYRVSVLDRCLLQVPSVQGLVDRGTDEGGKTIQAALSKPGKSVAVVDLNFLMRANGILDRLKAQGATISVPE
jgi:uncharacterized protein YbaP (TraB family)